MSTLPQRHSARNIFQSDQFCNPNHAAETHAREIALAGAIFAACGLDAGESRAASAVVAFARGAAVVTLSRPEIAAHLRVHVNTATGLVARALVRLQRGGVPLIVETARGVFDLRVYGDLRRALDAATADDATADDMTATATEIVRQRAGRPVPVPGAGERQRRAVVSLHVDPHEAARRWLARLDHERGDLSPERKRANARAFLLAALRQLDGDDGENTKIVFSADDAADLAGPDFEPARGLLLGIEPAGDGDDGRSLCVVGSESLLSSEEKEERPTTNDLLPTTPARPGLTAGDERVIERAARGRHGDLFARLLAGDLAGKAAPDHAALALLARLAYWTRTDAADAATADPEQVARIFAVSGFAGRYDRAWVAARIGRETVIPGAVLTVAATTDPMPTTRPRNEEERAGEALALVEEALSPERWTPATVERERERAESVLFAFAVAGRHARGWSEMEIAANLFDATGVVGRVVGAAVCREIASAAVCVTPA